MRFLLIIPNGVSPKNTEVRNHIPIGAISLLSVIKNEGHDVILLDTIAESYRKFILNPKYSFYRNEIVDNEEFRKTGLLFSETISIISEYNPDLIGISCLTIADRAETKFLVENLKNSFPNTPIILGGHEVSQSYVEILGFGKYTSDKINGVDFVSVGFGQQTIRYLLKYYQGKIKKSDIKGIAYIQDNHLVYKPIEEPFNPNNFALPDYSLLSNIQHKDQSKPIDIYSLVGNTHAGRLNNIFFKNGCSKIINYLPLITSYGCGFNCKFCDNEPQLIRYSSQNVLSMIEGFNKLYNIDYIDIIDNNFGGGNSKSRKTCFEIIEILSKKSIPIGFSNGLTFESMYRNNFELLKNINSHCILKHIAFPIENTTPRILKMINKPHTIEMVEETLSSFISIFSNQIVNKEGFFIGGFPSIDNFSDETPEELENTYNFVEKCFKNKWLDQAIFLTLSPVSKSYREKWRESNPDGAFELTLFSKGVGFWAYDPNVLKNMHFRIKTLNEKNNKSITRQL